MTDAGRLNETILDLLVPNAARDLGAIAGSLEPGDWDYILARSREHRFLPLLNWTLAQCAALDRVPPVVRQTLAETYRQQSLRALIVQRELLLLHRLLDEADVAHVFLKGSFLAQVTYPHPALRPVRDLDVVVRPQDAERAQTALVTAGYTPRKEAPGMISAYVEQEKHLPALMSPSRRMKIELHVHVDRPDGILAGLDAFRNIAEHKLGGETLHFMDPTDLLVHLCVHAANVHGFNNGPLIVADIGFLLQNGNLDAECIKTRAAELGVSKPVALTLALTESCWGSIRNGPQGLFEPVSPEILAIARQLCLRSFDERGNVDFFADLARPKSKAGTAVMLVRKLFPSGKRLALEFGEPQSALERLRFHVRHCHRILVERLPELIRGYRQIALNAEVEDAKHLKAWLET